MIPTDCICGDCESDACTTHNWFANHKENNSYGEDEEMHRRRNKHHIRPRSRNGGNNRQNLLLVDEYLHQQWHWVFGNRTLDEVIELLIRVRRAKENQGWS